MLECTSDVHKHTIWRHKQHRARSRQSRRKLCWWNKLVYSVVTSIYRTDHWQRKLRSEHNRFCPFLTNKLRQRGRCVLIKTSEILGLVFKMLSSLIERNKIMASSLFGLYSCNFLNKGLIFMKVLWRPWS